MLFVGICLLNTSCSTITPSPIQDEMASYDSTVPKEYRQFSSGFLGFIENSEGEAESGILSDAALCRYNALISSYRIQFKETWKIDLDEDDGITPYTDKYGNKLHLIDVEHLQYFIKLNHWNKEDRPNDTAWMKLKDKVL